MSRYKRFFLVQSFLLFPFKQEGSCFSLSGLPSSPAYQQPKVLFALLHSDHTVSAFLQDLVEVFPDLGIGVQNLQYLPGAHPSEPAFCF